MHISLKFWKIVVVLLIVIVTGCSVGKQLKVEYFECNTTIPQVVIDSLTNIHQLSSVNIAHLPEMSFYTSDSTVSVVKYCVLQKDNVTHVFSITTNDTDTVVVRFRKEK